MKNNLLLLFVILLGCIQINAQTLCTFNQEIFTVDSVLCTGDSTTLSFNYGTGNPEDTVVSTPIVNNNGQDGNMFDITATNPILIRYFEGNIANTPNLNTEYFVYYKVGTHVGFENNPGAWTLISGPVTFAPNAPNTLSFIPVNVNIVIPAGQTYAFYLTNTSAVSNNNRYHNGTATGVILASNSDLTIYEGTGGAYPFGTFFNARPWEGTVHYENVVDYLWNTGATTSSITVQPLITTAYSVTATFPTLSCIVQDTINIEVNDLPVISLNDATACGSITLDAGNPGSTYQWCSGETTQTITATQPGLYCVTVTNADGCTGSDSMTLTLNSQLLLDMTANGDPVSDGSTINYCNSANLQLGVNGNAGDIFLWTGPNGFSSALQNPLITDIQTVNSGTYSLEVMNVSGCIGEASFTLEVVETPIIDPVSDIVVCNGDLIPAILINGSVEDVEYTWTNDNTSIGLGAGGTGDITAFNAVNTGSTVQVATIEVNAVNGGSIFVTDTFFFTGAMETFTVPDNVDSVHIEAWGAQGGANWVDNTNFGGFAEGDLVVTPGQELYLFVGEQPLTLTGGWNGGGAGDGAGRAGGGASDVRIGGTTLNDRVIVGAGAGGAGFWSNLHVVGGIGGGLTGGDGYRNTLADFGGQGAFQNGPGAFGTCINFMVPAMAGAFGQGGSPLGSNCGCEGYGGGGGWYGGAGSGNCRGGGGGSSYIDGVLNGFTTGGVNVGNGFIVLSYAVQEAACNAEPEIFTITVNPTPSVTALPASQTVCSGTPISTIVLSGPVSGTTYNWTRDNTASVTGISASGSGNISGTLVNNTGAPITVTFTITPVANNCTGTAITATVIVNPSISISAAPPTQTICSGASITTIVISGGPGGTVYNWTRDNTATVTGIAASGSGNISGSLTNTTNAPVTVTFTVTPSANGCPGTAITATVIVNPIPNAVATPSTQTICSGSAITTIVLSGNVISTTYSWTRNNTATVTGIAASGSGNITGILTNNTNAPVTVTFTITPSVNSCTGTPVTATVIVNPTPATTVSATPNPVCVGEILQLNASGGTSYSWSGPDGFSSTLQNPVRLITGVSMAGTYSVTVTATGGCLNIGTVNVSVNDLPDATMNISPTPACVGSIVQFSASGGNSYEWSGPQGWTSTQQNPTMLLVNHLQSGKYYVTITNAAGCSVILVQELDVLYPPVAEADYEVSTACVGSDLSLHASGFGGYEWTGPLGWTSTLKDPLIPDVTAANSGMYILTVISPNGCIDKDTLNITINNLPALSANPVFTKTCEGSAVQLFATGSGTFSWTGPWGWVSTDQNPVIVNIPLYLTGTYNVNLTGSTGCTASQSVFIEVYPYIKAEATATPDTVCEGQSLQLHASGGSSYLWNGPDGFNSTESDPRIDNMTMAKAGKYYVYITNDGGCFGYTEVLVHVLPSVKATATATPNPVNEFSSVQFNSSDGVSHSWTGPNGFTSTLQNPFIKSVTRKMAGIYIVTIINENGCPSIVKINLRVLYTNKNDNSLVISDEIDDVSIPQQKSVINTGVYPNPTNDILYFDTKGIGSIQYMIYDVTGKMQLEQKTTVDNYISTGQLSTGIYQIRWRHEGSEEWNLNRFVKIR